MTSPLYLSDADVRALLSPEECAQVIEDMFRQEAVGSVETVPTAELHMPTGPFRVKVGGVYGQNVFGYKAYLGGTGYRVFVYDIDAGFQGIVEAFEMTERRTGAVSAVAAKYMARPESETLGIIGTGREARAQLRALSKALPLRRVKAYSRSEKNRRAYAVEMAAELKLDVAAVDSAEECVRGSDVVVTITSANDPVLSGAWLEEGAFVCGVGATGLRRRELDEDAVRRASLIVVENLQVAMAECGEIAYVVERGGLSWDKVHPLMDVVSGRISRRQPSDVTLFSSIGTGPEDVAVAAHVLGKARAQGVGLELPLPPPTLRSR